MPADLARQADAAAAQGDLATARQHLEALIQAEPTVDNWMKLGAISRAQGDFPAAMRAVEKALAMSPLDFSGLLSRAMLLEKMGDPMAGEAFGRALAQCPPSLSSGPMQAAIAHAQRQHEIYISARDERLRNATAPAVQRATAEEVRRIDRFRSNAIRKTRPYHSEPTDFHFPGLLEREFHDDRDFPWLAELAAATDVIAAEFERVAGAERAELVPYIQYHDHEPLQQWRALNQSRDWTAIHLLQNGRRVEANARHCPETMAMVSKLPQPDIADCSPNAMFSLLAPDTAIPPHTGIANTRLVCHLPLVVPKGCWFRVGAETRYWERGKPFVFDDTIEHEACNPTDQLRVVFILDIWHPGLTETERSAVRGLMEADATGAAMAL